MQVSCAAQLYGTGFLSACEWYNDIGNKQLRNHEYLFHFTMISTSCVLLGIFEQFSAI